MLGQPFSYYLLIIPAILIALTVHEVAHGVAAYIMGDSTAKLQGRLSLNPLHHIDPIGFLCMIVAGFGWAKPVQINPRNFKNPKMAMAITSFAGPLSNFILAFVCILIYMVGSQFAPGSQVFIAFSEFLLTMASLSVGLGVFNLIPIPPLDGSNIIIPFLPNKIRAYIYHYGQYIQFALVALLMFNMLDGILIGMRGVVMSTIATMAEQLVRLFM